MKKTSFTAGMAVIAATFSFTAFAQTPKATDGALTNAAGMTLYTFDKDTAGNGKSVCNRQGHRRLHDRDA